MTRNPDRFDRLLAFAERGAAAQAAVNREIAKATPGPVAPVVPAPVPMPRLRRGELTTMSKPERLAHYRGLRARRARREAERDKGPTFITSTRGTRYVDHTACPMCGALELGIEYHGQLRSGAKVHTLQAHTAEHRRSVKGQPRCLGAGMKLLFEDGVWKGAPA